MKQGFIEARSEDLTHGDNRIGFIKAKLFLNTLKRLGEKKMPRRAGFEPRAAHARPAVWYRGSTSRSLVFGNFEMRLLQYHELKIFHWWIIEGNMECRVVGD